MTLLRDRLRAGLPRLSPLRVFIAVAACHGALVLLSGVTLGGDSHSYDRWSSRLIESGFDYASVAAEASAASNFPAVLYAVFVSLVALLKLAFGANWPTALVCLNVAADAGLAVLLVRLTLRATDSIAAGWTALILYLICFDSAHWVCFTLSDTSFGFLAFTIFALVAGRILGDKTRWGGIILLAIAGVFYRPTGIVLLPDLAWAAWLSRLKRPLARMRWLAAGGAAGIGGGALLFAAIVQDPRRWPFGTLSTAFGYVARDYRRGEVVSARFETYHQAPSSLGDYLLISLDRFAHFFAPGAADFSLAHWLLQLLFFIPAYGLAAWFLIAVARGRTGLEERQRRVFLAAAGAVLAYALFHGLVQVDFDWRYRLPILPHLILLAAGGVACLGRERAR